MSLPTGTARSRSVWRRPAPPACRRARPTSSRLRLQGREGEEVTLTAAPNAEVAEVEPPPPSWAGVTRAARARARAPAGGQRTETVTALFSPQHVTVDSVGPERPRRRRRGVRARGRRAPGVPRLRPVPDPVPADPPSEPVGPAVVVTWEPSTCMRRCRCRATCSARSRSSARSRAKSGSTTTRRRTGPTIGVSFRVFKQGSGSGTVRGRALDCGSRCVSRGNFGDRETLVADPAPGSGFAGWRGVCAHAPRCSFAAGPVTSAVAVFDRADAPSTGPGRSGSGAASPATRHAPFAARLERVTVTGHGRRRQVRMRVRLNAPGTVRAALLRSGHRAAHGRWQAPAGTPLLRLRVPPRHDRGVSARCVVS